jgi:GntR family transcriptional regulator
VLDAINKESKLPYYNQFYEMMRDRIIDGDLSPGQALPTEQELVERYSISRTTVRHALDQLANEGLVYRQSGRGSFVAHPTVEQGTGKITSFTEDMRQRGFTPRTEVLRTRLPRGSATIAEKLGVAGWRGAGSHHAPSSD